MRGFTGTDALPQAAAPPPAYDVSCQNRFFVFKELRLSITSSAEFRARTSLVLRIVKPLYVYVLRSKFASPHTS